mgnify:CR=1 FL=1
MSRTVRFLLCLCSATVIGLVAQPQDGTASNPPGPWCHACSASCNEGDMEDACSTGCNGREPWNQNECWEDEWDFCEDSPERPWVVPCEVE